jgi:hypothetical protein
MTTVVEIALAIFALWVMGHVLLWLSRVVDVLWLIVKILYACVYQWVFRRRIEAEEALEALGEL